MQHAEPIERREGHGSPMYRYDRPIHEIHSSFSKRLFQVLQTGSVATVLVEQMPQLERFYLGAVAYTIRNQPG